MRSIWNGAITFGLVSIPVGLYTAVEEKSPKFNMLHAKDNGRIRQKRVCTVCNEEVPWEEIAKGFEYEKDRYVVFTEEEIARIPAESIRAVDIVAFVPLEEIDPIYFNKSYYLAPEPTGLKAYRLLERALKDTGRIGIAKVTLRDKERIATLRLRDGVFVLETMYWPDEVREPDFDVLDKDVDIRRQELEMAKSLVENLSADFDPTEFEDEYRIRVEQAVQQKIEGQEIAMPATEEPTPVVDLMEALKASVEATKKGASSKPEKSDGAQKPKAKAKAS
jgi:DNA end-binding protein Ku